MFEDSLIESGNKLKTKRGLTTFLSFGLQIALVGVLVLIPLLFTEALPKTQLMTFLVAPPPPPPPPPPPGPPVPPGAARPAVVSRAPRWLPMAAVAVMILVLGIGIGVVGTIGVAAVSRHFHHRGPAAVGPDFHRFGPRGPRVVPPNQRPVRPGLPVKPGQPAQPVQPATPNPSPTG